MVRPMVRHGVAGRIAPCASGCVRLHVLSGDRRRSGREGDRGIGLRYKFLLYIETAEASSFSRDFRHVRGDRYPTIAQERSSGFEPQGVQGAGFLDMPVDRVTSHGCSLGRPGIPPPPGGRGSKTHPLSRIYPRGPYGSHTHATVNRNCGKP